MIGHHILVLKIPLDTASYRLPYGSKKLKENQILIILQVITLLNFFSQFNFANKNNHWSALGIRRNISIIFTTRQRSCGKGMFSLACVCSHGGEGVCLVHPWYTLNQKVTPQRYSTVLTPSDGNRKRAVRILLECFLVTVLLWPKNCFEMHVTLSWLYPEYFLHNYAFLIMCQSYFRHKRSAIVITFVKAFSCPKIRWRMEFYTVVHVMFCKYLNWQIRNSLTAQSDVLFVGKWHISAMIPWIHLT